MDRYPDTCDPFVWANAFSKDHCVYGSIPQIAEWFKMAFKAGMHGYEKRDYLWKQGILAVGDHVSLPGLSKHSEGVIRAIDGEDAWVLWSNGTHGSYSLKALLRVDRRKLAVGDRVGISANPYCCSGVILMIDSGMAWVKQSDGRYLTVDLNNLTRSP